jgi:aspartyl-tRNA(Asn)/glutamyl-tRNA(Gln) amidotransferase subunit A
MNLFSIRELGQLILDKKTSSLELAQDLLADIKARDTGLSAFTSVNPELLIAEATKADSEIASGNYRGPLHGIPIGLKDIVNVASYSTQCGSPLYPSTPATSDSDVAASLKNSGAVIAGKTTSHELACGVTSPPES